MTIARDIAVEALRDRSGNVSARLDSLVARRSPDPADRALARELTLGVVRRRGTLNAVLKAFLRRPDHRPPGAVTEILQVGAYQLLFLDRVPDFAAVDEAVRQTGARRHRRQSGLVNGVLRNIARSLSAPQDGQPPRRRDAVGLDAGRFRTFDRDVFADPDADPAGWLAGAHSMPAALAKRWLARYGPDKAAALGIHANARPPLILRVNRLRATVDATLERLRAAGVKADPHADGRSVVLREYVDVPELDVFRDGWVQPQDATASAVAPAAGPRAGQRVLDFCAAPGTKTTHLAELMDNDGHITAVDVSADKLGRIEENCRRLGVDIVETRLAEDAGKLDPSGYDVVLTDAPCSGTGVLARRVEARWRFRPDKIERIVADQRWIARAAAQFVRPGGRLVYSTCSLEPEECEDMAAWLDRPQTNLRLVRQELTLPDGADDPTRWRDGGFTAVFEANGGQ